MDMNTDLAVCCSNRCEKRFTCKRQYISGCCEDYYSFGSGGLNSDGKITETYWCGPLGNYNMYIPIDKSIIINEFNKVIKMSEEIGYPIKLYPESENTLSIYYNEEHENMLLVNKYLCR